jgi:hypothetical protein
VAYPLGLKGVIVGEDDTYEEALKDGNQLFNSISRRSGVKCSNRMLLYWKPLSPKREWQCNAQKI